MHEVLTAECCLSESQIKTPDLFANSFETLLFYPVLDNRLGYCNLPTIQRYQEEDNDLQQAIQTNPRLFRKQIDDCSLICTQPTGQNWKIIMTDALLPRIVKWYHEFLMYTEGGDRL